MNYSIVANDKVLMRDLSLSEAQENIEQMKRMIMAGIATNYSEKDLEIRCDENK